MKKNNVELALVDAPIEIGIAKSIIEKFKIKNKVDFKLMICLSFQLEEYGLYNLEDHGKIYVNPDLRKNEDAALDFKKNEYYGYLNDYSLLSNTIHEFSHFLCYEVYDTIINDYKKRFNVDRLYLCKYSNENIEEEIAEIMRLYILNPLLLRLISLDVYNFFKGYFKSPCPSTQKYVMQIVDQYPIEVKTELKDKWGIAHDYNLNKIVKIERNVKND